MVKKQAHAKPKLTLFEMIERFFERRLSLFFILSVVLTIFLGFYLFEVRISEGGDDSGYVESAKKFMDGVAYPGFHGTFYSIFLSWVMRIVGFKLFLFKFTSYLFLIGHLIFFYYTFKGKISSTVLVMAMLISSVSSELLYFGSQTYTEAMYLFLQSALFYLVIKHYDEIKNDYKLIFRNWWTVLLVGLLLFTMSITRNIGILVLGVVLLYLLTEKKFYLAGYTLLSFILLRIPFGIYKSVRWNIKGEDMSVQLEGLLLKNYYNPSQGKEDFGGMIDRFLENSQIYLSRLFMTGAGLKDPSNSDTSVIVTLIIYALFAMAIVFAIRRSKVMRFVGYYLGVILFVTFVILQQHWGQMRLIIIYFPLIFILLPWGLIELGKVKKLRLLQPAVVLFLIIVFFKLFSFSVNKAKANNDVLMKNLKGNKYTGYTPDWVNFLKMSEWSAKNIPEESMIASRKPSMSFIYGDGRRYFGLYRFPSLLADTALHRLGEKPGDPVILNERTLRSSGMPRELQLGMKRNVEVFLTAGDTTYSIFFFPEQYKPGYLSILQQYNVKVETDLEILHDRIRTSGKPGIAVVPDSLINLLHRSNVDYLIRGNLRLNPAQKTERVINTVHRYMYFMEQKYYGIFSQTHQIGDNNGEPAYLFQIHWERFGLD